MTRTWVVARPGKWDLLTDLSPWPIEALWVPPTRDLPDTVARALPLTRGSEVLLGLPDIAFAPTELFDRACERHASARADLTLVLVPAQRPERSDTVESDGSGRVTRIEVRQASSRLPWVWIGAVWGDRFGTFLARWTRTTRSASSGEERHLGRAFAAAVASGLAVEGAPSPEARWLDIGTPEDLARSCDWPDVAPAGHNGGT